MKKYFLLFLIALIGCTKTIDKDKLQFRSDGKAYEINTDTPFTGKVEYKDGSIVEYKGGSKDGECVNYYSKGKKESERNYKNGKLFGSFKSWYDNGQMRIEATFGKEGTPIDELKCWHYNGQLKYDANIVDMSNIQLKAFDENGNIIEMNLDEFKFDIISHTILR